MAVVAVVAQQLGRKVLKYVVIVMVVVAGPRVHAEDVAEVLAVTAADEGVGIHRWVLLLRVGWWAVDDGDFVVLVGPEKLES